MLTDADALFKGTTLIAIPHSDDETLGCGAAIAEIRDKTRLHFVYVSDGAESPQPPLGVSAVSNELRGIRQTEARNALSSFGVPVENAHFLNFPDGGLSSRMSEIEHKLMDLCARLKPDTLVAPFRYDSHPDHLAVNRAATHLVTSGHIDAELIEYFVYFRLQLLPKKDIRAYIKPKYLHQVGSAASLAKKRATLDCYASQCTLMYPWQTRPLLTKAVLDSVVERPEFFFKQTAGERNEDIFTVSTLFIRTIHALEPKLKKAKDRIKSNFSTRKG